MTALGLDFGTTNTVIALPADGENETRSLTFESLAGTTDTMRTCLSFMKDRQAAVGAPLVTEAGAAAIRTLIDHPGECRFLQSIKTYAASPLFSETAVLGRRHSFADLMAVFLEKLMAYAGDGWPRDVARVVAGRPVRFAGIGADETLALERYNDALSRFGFPEIRFVLEPVAAAWYFASRLESDANVLVADFGGGTTDYSIIRFSKSAGKLSAEPLSHSGVGVAGDMFDYRIIDNVVSPMLGKGTTYRSFGKNLDVPSNYYASFGRWSQLSIFKTTRDFADLKSLVRDASDPEALELFIELIENDEGYPLYEAVSAAKRALSENEEAEFFFAPLGRDSRRMVRRADFEGWISGELRQMEDALDEAIAAAGIAATEIDKVFLTGGSSFVPAVRNIFENRFDVSRIETGGELLSIAHGLALIGAEENFPHEA
ncbi:Hsp70 family protein [Martelella lutilitoris]|uniref:Hsp70 family protein n=1 Tax=Martelella lutilitoris TaxID=2583532 RepID=A0A7T7HK08_9HYPH|nr:Hsp70 family protein [Martelella lutilitoris]QQM30522.1 Hsp70 family protein [Martelella lutilitoris]